MIFIGYWLSDNKNMDRKLLVLYGSETGTAEDLAYTIYEMASARSIVSSCLSLEFFDPQCLLKPVNVVFCVSTTGKSVALI